MLEATYVLFHLTSTFDFVELSMLLIHTHTFLRKKCDNTAVVTEIDADCLGPQRPSLSL